MIDRRFTGLAIMLLAKLVHRFDNRFGLIPNGLFSVIGFQLGFPILLKFVNLAPVDHPVVLVRCLSKCLYGFTKARVQLGCWAGIITTIGPLAP